ncbi:polyketide cyclase [Deltaproteobacteria bacterium]|nr:polyketide cyclase [Deltaproteobacteria bacterium]
MKKILLVLAGVLVAAVLGLVGATMAQPDTLHIERSLTISASAADIAPYTTDFDLWQKWSPWEKKDPAMKQTYSEPKSGVGAWYEWTGNDEVGHGKMIVLESAPTKVVHDLEFFSPWQSKALITFSFVEAADATTVTWAMDEKPNFSGKMAGLFMDMDAMLGADFAAGLSSLKPLAEADATERKATEAAAAAAAAAATIAVEAPVPPAEPSP